MSKKDNNFLLGTIVGAVVTTVSLGTGWVLKSKKESKEKERDTAFVNDLKEHVSKIDFENKSINKDESFAELTPDSTWSDINIDFTDKKESKLKKIFGKNKSEDSFGSFNTHVFGENDFGSENFDSLSTELHNALPEDVSFDKEQDLVDFLKDTKQPNTTETRIKRRRSK